MPHSGATRGLYPESCGRIMRPAPTRFTVTSRSNSRLISRLETTLGPLMPYRRVSMAVWATSARTLMGLMLLSPWPISFTTKRRVVETYSLGKSSFQR